MDPVHSDQKKQKPSSNYLKYGSLGLQLFGAIGLSAWVGHALDTHFQLTLPLFLISLVMVTFAGMMVQVYRAMNKD